MKFRPSLWPIVSLCLLAGACDRQKADDESTFRFINRGDIFTLDLNEMSYGQDIRVTYLMREGLYSPTGPQWTPQPANAIGCDVSPDKKVYTFHLRPEARWSNGDAVVAGDYVFSWRLMLEQPGEYTYLFGYINGADDYKDAFAAGKRPEFKSVGVEALDDHTLKVTLKQPCTYLLDLVAFTPFYPRHAKSMLPFRDKEPNPTTGGYGYSNLYTRPPAVVTNGPFALTSWDFKRKLTFTRNPNYWDAKNVKLKEVDMLVNESVLTQYLQYAATAVDWVCEVPPEISPELREKGEAGLKTSPSFGTAFLTLTCKPKLPTGEDNPMADVRVRQAMAMAVDKQFIVDQITRMGEAVAATYVPPGTLPGYASLPGLSRDVAKAKQLLADAGFPDGRGLPRLTLLYNSENTARARLSQAIKQQWKQTLGINVEIEGVEGKIFTQRVSHKEFSIATVSWYGDYPDVSTFTDKYLSTSLQNDASWFEPRYDALLAKAAAEADVKTRIGLLQQAENLINTEVPIIPLYHYVNVTLIGPRTSGVEANPRNLVRWKDVNVGKPARP